MKKSNTKKEAFLKACNFCAYQERTQQEVRDKLYELGLFTDEVEDLICTLIEENFINEERFAKTYAGSKFRIKKWGRLKIEKALKDKRISSYCIKQGMAEIEEEEYLQTLSNLLQKKYESLNESNTYIRKNKTAQYLLSKGYENYLIWEKIEEMMQSDKKTR